MTNKELEAAIVDEYYKLNGSAQRMEARLACYTAHIGSGVPGRAQAYCDAQDNIRKILLAINALRQNIERM